MTKKNDIKANDKQEALLFQDACTIIEQVQESAYRQVNEALIKRNWLLGMRIQHEVLKDKRVEYGEQVVKNLAEGLMQRYGKGFTWRNLYNYIDFYTKHDTLFYQSGNINLASSEILHAVSGKSENIFQSLTGNDELMCPQGHNPTIGLILCADTDDDVAHYSVLNGSDQVFVSQVSDVYAQAGRPAPRNRAAEGVLPFAA